MSKLYEAEIKFVSPQPITQEDIEKGIEKATKIHLVNSSIQNMGNSPYEDEYFFSEDKKNHVRFRRRENRASEITSKRFMYDSSNIIRVEPELEVHVLDGDVESLYCLMHNMGFSHQLSVRKTHVIMMDGYFESETQGTVPIQISSYTASARYPSSNTELTQSKHFFEAEINKAFLEQPQNAMYAAADELLKLSIELRDCVLPLFPHLKLSSQLLPSHFTDYEAQYF